MNKPTPPLSPLAQFFVACYAIAQENGWLDANGELTPERQARLLELQKAHEQAVEKIQ